MGLTPQFVTVCCYWPPDPKQCLLHAGGWMFAWYAVGSHDEQREYRDAVVAAVVVVAVVVVVPFL